MAPVIMLVILCNLAFATLHFEPEFLEKIKQKYGEYAKRRIASWEKLIAHNQHQSIEQKLELVNTFFNLIEFKTDMANWGVEDYWATPVELLVSGGADCDDYAVAKYFTLIELGVPEETLLIAYVQALEYNQAHMVLTYYATPESIPLILDNLRGEILPGDKRTDLKPIYSFNAKGLWQSKQQGLGRQLGEVTDLHKWNEMHQRMLSGEIGNFRRE